MSSEKLNFLTSNEEPGETTFGDGAGSAVFMEPLAWRTRVFVFPSLVTPRVSKMSDLWRPSRVKM